MTTQFKRYLHDWYSRLTHPPISTDNIEDNLRMRLTSSLFLCQTLITLLILFAYSPLQSDRISQSALVGYSLLSLVCYGISRTGYYKWGILLYIALMMTILFGVFVASFDNLSATPEYSLSYLSVVIFITSLVLSVRATLVVSGLSLIGIALLPLMVVQLRYPVHYLWLFMLVTSVLIVITVMIRRDVFRRLQESENRARSLMEAYIDAVAIHAHDHGIIAVNPVFTDLLGYTSDAIEGVSMQDLAADDRSRQLIQQYIQLDQKSAPCEVQLLPKNGESIIVELISQPHIFENQPAQVFVIRDRRMAIEALRQHHEQEIRYQSLLDLTDDAVFICDFKGKYIAVNQKAADMLGLTVAELTGRTFHEFVPEAYHTAEQRVIDRLLAGRAVPMYDRIFVKANGHRFPTEVMMRLLRDIDGNPQYIHSVVRDISERKRAEEQRLELALERERMSTLQHFLNDASHYFRTPLTSLKTSQYLLTQIRNNPEKQAHFLNIMKLEIDRLERLISDMMLSTQLERDSGNGITFGRMDLADALPEIVETFSPAVKREAYAQIIIEPDIPKKTLYIMASRPKLGLAIHRLLDNAITYSPVDSQVIVHAYQDEDMVCIEIIDSGIGITEDEMPILFQRFRRADRAIEMAHVGNGLGLFIARKIIEMHYGEIRVSSTPDIGSTFTVSLPLAIRTNPKNTKEKTNPSA